MIVYKKYKEIDKQKWDQCIQASPNGLVFAYSWYLDAVCDSWDALVLNDYEAVFPITRKSKVRIHYFFNPIFALQLGVFSKKTLTSELVLEFIEKIPSKIKLTDIYLNYANEYKGNEYEVTLRKCQQINLIDSYDVISARYSTNLKRNLAKAHKNKLEIVLSLDESVVVTLFKENGGDAIKDITEKHFTRLENLIRNMKTKKMAKIYECWSGKELVATACFSICNGRITYIKGGSTKTGRDLGAMHMIMDEVIHLNSGKEMIFDFGGSSIPAVAKFNANFGVEEYTYQRLYRNNLPLLLKILKK